MPGAALVYDDVPGNLGLDFHFGDKEKLFIISGNGDVIEPEHDVAAIGSGGSFALSAARALAAAHWPGPLTLVLPRRPDCRVDHLTGAGLDSLGVRVPAHPLALALLRA